MNTYEQQVHHITADGDGPHTESWAPSWRYKTIEMPPVEVDGPLYWERAQADPLSPQHPLIDDALSRETSPIFDSLSVDRSCQPYVPAPAYSTHRDATPSERLLSRIVPTRRTSTPAVQQVVPIPPTTPRHHQKPKPLWEADLPSHTSEAPARPSRAVHLGKQLLMRAGLTFSTNTEGSGHIYNRATGEVVIKDIDVRSPHARQQTIAKLWQWCSQNGLFTGRNQASDRSVKETAGQRP